MTVINPHSKLGYLAIRKESVENTILKPNVFIELLSESVVVNWQEQSVMPVAGSIEMNRRTVHDKATIEGTITIPVEARTVGYILSNFFGAPTTTNIQSGKVWEHVFTPQETPQTYTFEIRVAGDTMVRRFGGVKVTQLQLNQSDNKMQLQITIKARSAFETSRITTGTSSATQLHVEQTKGLTTSDVVELRDADDYSTVNATASISSIPSETVVVLGGSVTVAEGDIMTIRKSTVNYSTSKDMIWIGGSKYQDGRDINNAETTNDTEDATYIFNREGEDRHAANGTNQADRFPSAVKLKGFNSEGTFQHFYASPKFTQKTCRGAKTGLRTKIYGVQIDTNSAQAAVLQFGSGNSLVAVTASVASETSNNLNVTVIANNVDTLAATKSGNDIVVKLANTDTTKNTATLVAAAINALSGVGSAAGGTGAGEVSTLTKSNLGSGSFNRGRDANEKELLRIDFPDARFKPFAPNLSEDNIVQEEIGFTGIRDTVSGTSVKVLLRNNISSYA